MGKAGRTRKSRRGHSLQCIRQTPATYRDSWKYLSVKAKSCRTQKVKGRTLLCLILLATHIIKVQIPPSGMRNPAPSVPHFPGLFFMNLCQMSYLLFPPYDTSAPLLLTLRMSFLHRSLISASTLQTGKFTSDTAFPAKPFFISSPGSIFGAHLNSYRAVLTAVIFSLC